MQTRHRVLGDASWTRGKVSKARKRLVTSRCQWIRAPSSNTPRGKMAASAFCRTPHARSLGAFRPREVDGTRAKDPRCAPAGFSQGPAYKSRPGLFTRQGQIEVLGSAGWIHGRGGTTSQNHFPQSRSPDLGTQAVYLTANHPTRCSGSFSYCQSPHSTHFPTRLLTSPLYYSLPHYITHFPTGLLTSPLYYSLPHYITHFHTRLLNSPCILLTSLLYYSLPHYNTHFSTGLLTSPLDYSLPH